ncbi:MAG TPA: cupin domain-containing protein [Aggregatilineales bacterium]|nr:cupin domain-containing protein [Aggregatilineales bacterium]
MEAFDLAQLLSQPHQSAYLEFLRMPSLSMGVYRLRAGGTDPQQPHNEDEVYYVVSGAAQIRVGREDRPVKAGSIVFVAAGLDHLFHSITEDMTILVFFAPAEHTVTGPKGVDR